MSDRARMPPRLMAIAACVLLFAPFAADAQQPAKIFRVGFLTGTPLSASEAHRKAFREGLRELGYVEGENIAIDWRFHGGDRDRQRALAAELARLKVDVIVAVGSGDIRTSREATATIPIVMIMGGDPVGSGFVDSLARPGGNITGLAAFRPQLVGKRLELLKEAVPGLARVAVFLTSGSDRPQIQNELGFRAKAIGVTVQYQIIAGPTDIETAFRAAVRGRADAVLFQLPGPIVNPRLSRIADLAMKSRLPAIYQREALVEAGGLMSYGVYRSDLFRRAAIYVAKILKGAKPADLPVQEPTRFKLVVNLKTAKTLGITLPPSILLRVDRVIE